MSTIHSRIKEQRIKNGYTLIEVAEKIGVREATYQRYESGVIKNIKLKIIAKLAEIFDVSPGYLMGWIDEETEKKNDIIANTVLRLQTDKKFFETVSILYNLPDELLDMVLDFLNTPFFQKELNLKSTLKKDNQQDPKNND